MLQKMPPVDESYKAWMYHLQAIFFPSEFGTLLACNSSKTVKGAWFDFSKLRLMLCLKNNHFRDLNFKFQLNRSKRLYNTNQFSLLGCP